MKKASIASKASTEKILIITYYWPPSGGAGVQRWLKFSKYLPEYGWEPIILTVDPGAAEYPAIDRSLEKEIYPDVKVFKTSAVNYFKLFRFTKRRSKKENNEIAITGSKVMEDIARFIRGNFFIPDPRIGWNRYALRKATELILREKIKFVITTSPPHSTQLIGLKLKKRFPEIRWISDLRDPWTGIYYYDQFLHTKFAKQKDSRLESEVLLKCDRVITIGKNLAEHFIGIMDSVKNKSYVIYNGYDETDFEGIEYSKSNELLITYVGTITDQYPLGNLVDILSSLNSRDPQIIRLRFVGTVSKNWRKELTSKLGESVEILPYCDHKTSIGHIISSNILLLAIPDHPGNRIIITGKIFEYMRSGLPILCLGPEDGEAATILKKTGAGQCFDYADREGIEKFIAEYIRTVKKYNTPPEYTRANLTKQLISVLS